MRWPSVVKIFGGLIVSSLVGYFAFGNRGYGEVSNKAYDIATALYSVCNRQDATKLAGIESLLTSAQSDASLSPSEIAVLQEILRTAQAGNWVSAVSESRALMEDQVKYP
jgi:hypothetical protein